VNEHSGLQRKEPLLPAPKPRLANAARSAASLSTSRKTPHRHALEPGLLHRKKLQCGSWGGRSPGRTAAPLRDSDTPVGPSLRDGRGRLAPWAASFSADHPALARPIPSLPGGVSYGLV